MQVGELYFVGAGVPDVPKLHVIHANFYKWHCCVVIRGRRNVAPTWLRLQQADNIHQIFLFFCTKTLLRIVYIYEATLLQKGGIAMNDSSALYAFNKFGDTVLRAAFAMTGCYSEAEDITQDVFLTLHASPQNFPFIR